MKFSHINQAKRLWFSKKDKRSNSSYLLLLSLIAADPLSLNAPPHVTSGPLHYDPLTTFFFFFHKVAAVSTEPGFYECMIQQSQPG